MNPAAKTPAAYDYAALVGGLNQYLRLRALPIGMKRYQTRAEMEAIPKVRRPANRHALDQIVGQARHLGWTIGITFEDLVGAQCGTPVGLHPRNEEWLSGKLMAGVWYADQQQAAAHLVTTALVLVNGVLVALVVIGVFEALLSIINAGVLW